MLLLSPGIKPGLGVQWVSTYDPPDHLWLSVFFTPSPASQAAGREFLKRFRLRSKDRDPEVNDKVAPAQRTAIAKWAAPREHPYDYLKTIRQPTLVVNGSSDVIIYTVNSFMEDGTAIGEVLAIWRYFEEVYPTPPLLGSTPKDEALVTMWERRTELEGFAGVMEGARNAAERLKGRASAGHHDYDQIPALVERSKLRGVHPAKYDKEFSISNEVIQA